MASKLSRNILQSAALSGVNPSTGQYLSSSQRKAIFRRSKISSANVFARSSSDLVAANSSAIVKYQDKSLSAKLDKVISYFERREREDKKIKKRELKLLREQKVERERQRELLRRKEKEEGLEGGFGKKLAKTLIAPIKSTAAKTQGILQRLLDFFLIVFAGWLTDKGLLAIKLNAEGNIEGLKNLAGEVGIALGAVTATLGLLNGGLLGIAATIGGLALSITGWLLTRPFKWARSLANAAKPAPRTTPTRQTGTPRGRTTVTQGRGGQPQFRNPLRPRPPVTQGRGGGTTIPGTGSRSGQMMRGSRPGSGTVQSGFRAPSIPQAPKVPPGPGLTSRFTQLIKAPMTWNVLLRGLRLIGLGFLAVELKEDWDIGDYYAIGVKILAFTAGTQVSALGIALAKAVIVLSGGLATVGGLAIGAGAIAGGIATDKYIREQFLTPEKRKEFGVPTREELLKQAQEKEKYDKITFNLSDQERNEILRSAGFPVLDDITSTPQIRQNQTKQTELTPAQKTQRIVKSTQKGGMFEGYDPKDLEWDMDLDIPAVRFEAASKYVDSEGNRIRPIRPITPINSRTVESQTAQVNPVPLRRPIPKELPEPAPNVIYRRVGGNQNQSASLKTGSATDVPLIPSSNPDNFYTMYSQMNYNVVE